MTQPTTGGLGGLGGYLGSRGFGNILQAAGMSLMSSPRNNPLAGFAQAYTGIQDQQMKLDERDQSRASLAAVLKAAGFNDEQAAILSADPNAVRAALEQKKLQDEKASDDRFYARMPKFGADAGEGSFGSLGSLGGAADDAIPAGSGDYGNLALPAIAGLPSAEIAPTAAPAAPTQTQFGLPGVAQMDPNRFTLGQTPPDDRALEPVANIPQEPVPAPASEQPSPGQSSGNKTVDWLKAHDPEAAKLLDQGFSVRDVFGIAQIRRQGQKQADATQSKLDQLYRYRDQYAEWASTARSDKSYGVAKRNLDNLDNQIARLEKQQARYAPPDGFRAMELRAEAAGLQPGTPEYQKFMASGGKEGSLVTINNSPEGDMFAGMPKDIREEMFKRQGEAQDAADLIGITNQGLQLLDQGAITGAGSGAKVAAVKWAQSVGVPIDGDIADAVNNAETYRAVMAQAVGKVIKNFGSGTGLSDADRQYAERLAGGDTTLNEPAIRRILAAGVKSAKSKIGNFNGMRDKVLSGDLSAILNVQEPPEYSAPAAGGGTRARNPQTGETLEWDGSQWRPVQ
ncbi:hypothetical protein ATER59S_05053 [Aquamicrobium terrae]